MKKLLYVEENFITPDECQTFIDYANANRKEMPYGGKSRGGDTFLSSITTEGHQHVHEITGPTGNPQDDGEGCAAYLGGDADFINMKLEKAEFFRQVVDKVTNVCKYFDDRANLDYVGVVRWPIGTFMNPHYDNSSRDGIYDIFAAMLYLNDDFDGGHTGFENFEITPKQGQLCIFSNSQYKHHVTKVESAERFVLSFWYNNAKPVLELEQTP